MLKLFCFSNIKAIVKSPVALPWGLSNSWSSLDQSMGRKDYKETNVSIVRYILKCTSWLNLSGMARVSRES